ncbi:FAD-dependent oxidoreductase, partial [Dietzia aerolata]
MTGPSVAVVGGGLSGLTAAYQLSRDLPGARITVLEASPAPGGCLDTVDFPSGPMELGAEAFIGRRPEAAELVAELGLADALQHPSGRSASILTGGRLVSMPAGTLMGLPSDASTLGEVLDPADVERAARETELPLDWEAGGDVSLGGLVAERFGPAVVTRLVDPML